MPIAERQLSNREFAEREASALNIGVYNLSGSPRSIWIWADKARSEVVDGLVSDAVAVVVGHCTTVRRAHEIDDIVAIVLPVNVVLWIGARTLMQKTLETGKHSQSR